MERIKKYFGSIELTWIKVIVFAVIAGLYTGVVAMIPALEDTSFQDISISFEWWILFGILIIMNSKSAKDSALKCFVFFLISQPLVYLVQIVFGAAGWDLFYYYRYWAIWTVLTIPMGYIGYRMKKEDTLGLLILMPILLLLGVHVFRFSREAVSFFPNHLLSTLFCIVTMFLYVNVIFSGERERKSGNLFCAVIVAMCLIVNILPGLSGQVTYDTILKISDDELVFDDSYSVYLEDDSFGNVAIEPFELDGEMLWAINAKFGKTGDTKLILENGDEHHEFDLTVGRSTYNMTQIE